MWYGALQSEVVEQRLEKRPFSVKGQIVNILVFVDQDEKSRNFVNMPIRREKKISMKFY